MQYVDGVVKVGGGVIPVSNRVSRIVDGKEYQYYQRNKGSVWLTEYISGLGVDFTHFFTLTYMWQPSTYNAISEDCMHFSHKVQSFCMKPSRFKKFKKKKDVGIRMVGVVEGEIGKNAHVHVLMEKPPHLIGATFALRVLHVWEGMKKTSKCQNDVRNYRDVGCIDYIGKTVKPYDFSALEPGLLNLERKLKI